MMVTLTGELVGLEMDAQTARVMIERIQEHMSSAEHHMSSARELIWSLKEYEGWKALGYKSWRQCVVAEFEQSATNIYRQLDAAVLELELSPTGDIGTINERVLRPLAKRQYSKESRQLIWDISQDIVGEGGKITSGVVESVVEGIADWLKSGTVQSPDGEQYPITEHLRADLTARVREVRLAHKEHIRRMDKPRDYILGGKPVHRSARYQEGEAMIILKLEDFDAEKWQAARKTGKVIYCSLWTED